MIRFVFTSPRLPMFLAMTFAMLHASGCTHPLKQVWQEYRQAKKDGDYQKVALYLAEDARIWFDKKEAPGHPLRPMGGPYKDWDKEFRAESTKEKFRIKGRTLSYISYENNDYFRLIERKPSAARVTYYFNEDEKISGMLYAGLTPRNRRPPDRFCEFEKWAEGRYAGLLDSEEMDIPNNPKRWRELLTEWRADVGLPPIE